MKTLRIVQTDPINWDRRKMVSISPNSPKSHKYVSIVDVFRVSDWSLHCAVVAAVDSEGATPRLCRRRAAAGDVIVCVPSCAVVPSCFNVTDRNIIIQAVIPEVCCPSSPSSQSVFLQLGHGVVLSRRMEPFK